MSDAADTRRVLTIDRGGDGKAIEGVRHLGGLVLDPAPLTNELLSAGGRFRQRQAHELARLSIAPLSAFPSR